LEIVHHIPTSFKKVCEIKYDAEFEELCWLKQKRNTRYIKPPTSSIDFDTKKQYKNEQDNGSSEDRPDMAFYRLIREFDHETKQCSSCQYVDDVSKYKITIKWLINETEIHLGPSYPI